MRLTFKTLDNKNLSLDGISPDTTVEELKRELGGREEFRWDPARTQEARLIFAGRVLSDPTQKLADCGMQDDDFLVVMPPRVATQRSRKTASVSSADAQLKTPLQAGLASEATDSATIASEASRGIPADSPPASVSAKSSGATPAESGALSQTPQVEGTTTSGIASSGLAVGDEYSLYMNRMRDMGFDDGSIERAMRAAHYNPERAIEYLCNGFPANTESLTEPLNDEARRPEHQTLPAQAGMDQTSRPAEAVHPELQQSRSELDIIRRLPHFALLRRAIQQDPSQIQSLLAELRRMNPRLLDIIQRNQADFINMLNEPVTDEEAGREMRQLRELVAQQGRGNMYAGADAPSMEPTNAIRIEVSQEEAEQLRQLEQMMEPMGVSRDTCLQVWLSCDRNTELAAMHLMDNLEDYTAEYGAESDTDVGDHGES
ncbi:nucleotide excision repair protein yeast rad23/ human HHR23A homolog [Cyanidioschyzon merolae strain 10D]|jgi:UV excision repair protein RAD23|uniref:UV excision repair protein RAD23 n=1 Tax=Cyanidioschyzon merolae (strain NIES-3377 / 10D) TaxID=280699 RepID=M1VHP3_CYAM1|nr:nucleotide excision repair protein yeast rad23/ human HHR23A homolog [Cyanidioschyzon merolae strain 10D]BAM80448.1 nucleotide excision repair protein yeast rad23/ human HHR23A homolog [Cyanidioschyzon merolae strain 10D]|eukprot:XP_005536484.1 nucleotide excision repair protein yeast rad23/ human HHR23A homolog [Cyanidioschyzon merolae strain 10D]